MPDLDTVICAKEKCGHPASQHDFHGPHVCLVTGCYCAWFHIPMEAYEQETVDEVEEEFASAVTEGSSEWVAIEPAVSIGKFENTNEIRTTSATGGQKGVKPERYDLIPVEALDIMSKLYGFGAVKYAAHNWRKGYEWSKSYASLMRHATRFWAGEDLDEETGLPHLAGVGFHAFTLMVFMQEFPDYDDRFKKVEESDDAKCVAHDDELARIMWESDTQEYLVSWDNLCRLAADPENFSGQRAAWLRTITMARASLKAGYYRTRG